MTILLNIGYYIFEVLSFTNHFYFFTLAMKWYPSMIYFKFSTLTNKVAEPLHQRVSTGRNTAFLISLGAYIRSFCL